MTRTCCVVCTAAAAGVDLAVCPHVGDAAVSALAHGAPHLAVLRMMGNVRLTDAGIASLASAVHHAPQPVTGTTSTSTGAASSNPMQHQHSQYSQYNIPHPRGVPQRTSSASNGLPSSSPVAPNQAPPCRMLSLHLDACLGLTDASLECIGRMRSLTSLRVVHCPGVTDAGVRALSGLSALVSLSLAHCSGVGGEGLAALTGLTGLASLEY